MSKLRYSITKEQAKDAVIWIEIDGDVILNVLLKREPDDSLYYYCFDEADLDGRTVIEGHLPEYFDEETANA